MRNVSETVRRAVYGQESGKVFVPIMTISHADMPTPVRMVGDTTDLVRGGNTYTALPFYFELPEDQSGRVQSIRIRVSNISRDLVEIIRDIHTALDVDFEVVRADDPTDTVAGPWPMKLYATSYNATTIEGELGRAQRMDIDYPKAEYAYTPKNVPGLF